MYMYTCMPNRTCEWGNLNEVKKREGLVQQSLMIFMRVGLPHFLNLHGVIRSWAGWCLGETMEEVILISPAFTPLTFRYHNYTGFVHFSNN